jgi:transcriptional regulator with XRE-family HTH domain
MNAAQCKMARAALDLGIRETATLAKVSPDTVARLERGEPLRDRTVEAIRAALEAAGVDFIAENGGGAGVRLRKVAPPQTDASLDLQIDAQKAAIAEMPEPPGPSPEAAIATMDKALAEKDLIDMTNKRTRRKIAKRK